MLQSLLVKLCMLAMTMGVVFWIGWQAPQSPAKGTVPVADPVAVGPPHVTDNKAFDAATAPAKTPAAAGSQQERTEIAAQPPRRGPLDLNRASANELESLPGIGAVLARRVIEFRTSAGGFRSVDDLRQVKGIGAKKFDRVRPLVMVAAPASKGKAEKQPS
jgi:competence protein ComEA